MFSVVIPLYNKEKYIAGAIRSVLDQTYQNFEIIIVDDGSTDKSVIETKKFDDERIYIFSQENAGVSATRNKGIKEAKFDFIAFLDADDIWENDFLETMVMLKDKYTKCSVFAVNYKIMSYDNRMQFPIINGMPKDFKNGVLKNYFQIASQSDPIICSISLAVKKEAIVSIGGFPEGIRAGEDLLTWARLAAQYDIAYSIEPKATFVRYEDNPNERRSLDFHDQVGEGLKQLLITGNPEKTVNLKKYIAYWYKIRVALFLRFGKQKEAGEELHKMVEYSHKDIKYYILAFIIYAPTKLSIFLYYFFNRLKSNIRKIKIILNRNNS